MNTTAVATTTTSVSDGSMAVTSSAYSGVRAAAGAAFGPTVASLPGGQFSGEVVYLGLGCTVDSFLADPSGKIALIERGTCTFVAKALNAQTAGAIGVIVFQSEGATIDIITMGGVSSSVVIPSVFVARSTGLLLRDGAAPVSATISAQTINLSGFSGSTTTIDSNTVITGTDDSGNVVSTITLPPGTISEGGSIEYTSSGANSMVQVSGIIVPYPPGKTIMTKSNPGTSKACIVDSSSVVSLEGLTCKTDVSQSKVVLDCSDAGVTTSISGFPESPSSRSYMCTKIFQNDQNYIQVSGLVYSALILDGTPPTITIVGAINDGDTFNFGSVPAESTCTAVDDLSELDGSCQVAGYSTQKGLHTLTASATDTSGNTAIITIDYEVLALGLSGFYHPVDMNGVVNYIKSGKSVPLKFDVFSGSVEMSSIGTDVIKSFTQGQISCSSILDEPIDVVEVTNTGGTELRYADGQYVQNWKTPSLPDTCWKVTLTTADDSSISAFFNLTK